MNRAVKVVSVASLALIAICAFALAVPGTMWAGRMAGLPTYLQPGVAIIIDASIVVYGLTALVKRAAGHPAKLAWLALGFSTGVSVLIQLAHVLVFVHSSTATPTDQVSAAVGLGVACLVPVCLLIAPHFLLDLAVAPPPTRRRRAAAAAQATTKTLTKTLTAAPAPAAPVLVVAPTRAVAVRAVSTPDLERDRKIRELKAQGLSNRDVANRLATSPSTVQRAAAAAATAVSAAAA